MRPTDIVHLLRPARPALLPTSDGALDLLVPVVGPDLEADAARGRIWRVAGDGSGSSTPFSAGPCDTAVQVSADGRYAYVVRSGDGPAQLVRFDLRGGDPLVLSAAPLGVSAPRLSPDGTRVVWTERRPQDGRYAAGIDPDAESPRLVDRFRYRGDGAGFTVDRPWRLMALDLRGVGHGSPVPAAVDLTPGATGLVGARWAPDGQALLVAAAVHPGADADLRSDLLRLEVCDELLVPGEDGEVARRAAWAAAERWTDAARGSTLAVHDAVVHEGALWLVAHDRGPSGREFVGEPARLWHAPLGPGGPGALVALTDVDLDLGDVLEPVTGGVLVVADQDGTVPLLAVGADGTSRTVLGGDVVVQHVVPDDAGGAWVAVADPASAGEVEHVDLATGARRRVTDLASGLRSTGRVHAAVPLTARSSGDADVHGWVVRPDATRYPGPHPVLLMIHGGPHAQYTSAVFDEAQVLAGAGYAVVLGNPRGSSGRGHDWARAIHRAMGTVDTDDVLALLDAALAAPDLDDARVGVLGGSYGGYLTAWLTTREHRFAAAVVERGFLDPVSFVGSSDIGWYFGLDYVGDAATPEGAALVASQSPMAHVGEVRTPTLVVHSEHDWRCPVEQGQRWYVELKRRGVPTRLLLFPGEGHELSRSGRPSHRVARFEHLLAWWSEHLPVSAGAATDA